MIGILGGTFDPVHFGHLRVALELYQALPFEEIRFIPCGQPPHRGAPLADASARLEMLQQAIAGQDGFVIDQRELQRQGPSYMVDTLASLRAEFSDRPLCLILGVDAFATLDTWHQWRQLPELAHLLVVRRPSPLSIDDGAVMQLLQAREVDTVEKLAASPAGCVLMWTATTQLDISATRIRSMIAAGISPRYLLPDRVCEYIQQQQLYR
jgi:nicotinate-nucleotide adenylyltransferase